METFTSSQRTFAAWNTSIYRMIRTFEQRAAWCSHEAFKEMLLLLWMLRLIFKPAATLRRLHSRCNPLTTLPPILSPPHPFISVYFYIILTILNGLNPGVLQNRLLMCLIQILQLIFVKHQRGGDIWNSKIWTRWLYNNNIETDLNQWSSAFLWTTNTDTAAYGNS